MPGLSSSSGRRAVRSLWNQRFEEHVGATAYSPDGHLIAIGRLSGCLGLHEATDGRCLTEPLTETGAVQALSFSPNGRWLAVGGESGTLEILALKDSTQSKRILLKEPQALSHWIQSVVWAEDSSWLAASCGRSLHFIDPLEGRITLSKVCDHTISSLQMIHKSAGVLAAASGGVWEFSVDPKQEDLHHAYPGVILKALCSPCRRYITAGLQDASIAIWDLETNDPLTMRGYARKVAELEWSPNSSAYRQQMFAAGGGAEITLWDFSDGPPEGEKPIFLSGHEDKVNDLKFLAKKPWLLSAADDGLLKVWQGSRGWQAGDTLEHDFALHSLVVSPKEDSLLVTGLGGYLNCYGLGSVES